MRSDGRRTIVKRPSQDVAGRPKLRDVRPAVAGQSISRSTTDVASYCHSLHDPISTAADDAALIEDFVDFLAGGEGFETGGLPAIDPAFMERLRRRLWRNYVVSHLRNVGKEPH